MRRQVQTGLLNKMNASRLNCIIVHGCPSDSSEEKTKEYAKHWMPWIKKELTLRGIKTETPLMPTPWHPDYNKFKKEFENIMSRKILY